MAILPPLLRLPLLTVAVATCAHSQTPVKPASSPSRTLIVSGGPSATYNQYAIESNARYVEKLTATSQQRVLFANGNRQSRTISTLQPIENAREALVLGWLLRDYTSPTKMVMKAPTLKRLDGDATPKTITREVEALASKAKAGERALIYFTGHGSEGQKYEFFRPTEDYENTVYSGWHGDVSMQKLSSSLKNWPADVPLTLVMVQCHSGGFGNLIWNGGDPKNGVWPRDFCGFFASTGERMASGCTSAVNERDYQDFTTHFFAALSGVSRDGRQVTGADFDHNGAVSGLEAFAYTNLHDDSIDVPVCTSDVYLRRTIGEPSDNSLRKWMKTPYSAVLKDATDWQKVTLNGLSQQMKLSGEARLEAAFNSQENLTDDEDYSEDDDSPKKSDENTMYYRYYTMQHELFRRFPALKSKKSRNYAAAKVKALAFLKSRPAQVAVLYKDGAAYHSSDDVSETREAKLHRFLRCAYTVVLQKRLQTRGTSEQKAVFARLRTSESRNFLK